MLLSLLLGNVYDDKMKVKMVIIIIAIIMLIINNDNNIFVSKALIS